MNLPFPAVVLLSAFSLGLVSSLAIRAEDETQGSLQETELAAIELRVEGRWLLGPRGETTPGEDFRRGLQTSGLCVVEVVERKGQPELLAVGDQRSQYPGRALRLDPRRSRWTQAPDRLRLPEEMRGSAAELFRSIPNVDLEGICADPAHANRFFAVTEDKTPWILCFERDGSGGFRITSLSEVRFPGGLGPWRDNTNFRLEGISSSSDGRELWLALERTSDDLPRLLRVPTERVRHSASVLPDLVPVDFGLVPRRRGKERARLNLNGLATVAGGSRDLLLAVARDQERILVIDPEEGAVTRIVDLVLRDPKGEEMLWVSPEAIACDPRAGRVYLLNDPDSVRGNYRRLADEKARDHYADYTPQLFELPLEALVGGQAGARK